MSILYEVFPTAEELGKETLKNILDGFIKMCHLVSSRGGVKASSSDHYVIGFIFHHYVLFEELGYEVSYDYPDDMDLEEVSEFEVSKVTLSWEYSIMNY